MLWHAISIYLNPIDSEPNNAKCGDAKHESSKYLTLIVQIYNMNRPDQMCNLLIVHKCYELMFVAIS